ncbi:MAG: hypothetical protein RL009_1226, partial [Actinomycetota bacterium]
MTLPVDLAVIRVETDEIMHQLGCALAQLL